MKKLFAFVFLNSFIVLSTFAQLPNGSIAPNFTINDIDGVQHELYDILDQGKPVLLDLFAVWCGPCWSFAETGVFDDFNEVYGNSVFVVAVEADPTTPESDLFGGSGSIGDWTEVIHYTLANDDLIGDSSLYNVGYYPTIYLICPDRSVSEIGQSSSQGSWNVQNLADEVFNYTCDPIQGVNVGIQSYNSELNYCGKGKIEPVLTISNTGVESVTSCTIETLVDGEVISSYDWTGVLPTQGFEQLVLDEIPGESEQVTFNIIASGDVSSSDDSLSVTFIPSVESHAFLYIDVNTDYYPGETSWKIVDADGQEVMSGDYEEGNDNSSGGGGVDAGMTYNYSASLESGCYTFMAIDESGDGQSSSTSGVSQGSIKVTDAAGFELLDISGDWGGYQYVTFEVTYGLELKDLVQESVTVYPNPTSANANVAITLTKSEEVKLELINALGQTVFLSSSKMSAGQNTFELPLESLEGGFYVLNTIIGDGVLTKKLSIIK
ncbi:MAG: T9SS type A sorting domain-containing protein [Flavobacteriales bacterium]